MKKIILTFAAVIAFGAANAQYKAKAGDVTTEFGLTGGINSTSTTFLSAGAVSGGTFKARMFKTDKMALRGILGVNVSTTDDKNTQIKTSNSSINLGVGVERHFTGTDRLATYVGGDFLVGFSSSKNTNSSVSPSIETKGPSKFGVGARGVFGADYYFAKHVYLGVEAGLSLMYEGTGKTKVNGTETAKASSSFTFAPGFVSAFKVGFVF